MLVDVANETRSGHMWDCGAPWRLREIRFDISKHQYQLIREVSFQQYGSFIASEGISHLYASMEFFKTYR
jgi:hypothetical protein